MFLIEFSKDSASANRTVGRVIIGGTAQYIIKYFKKMN